MSASSASQFSKGAAGRRATRVDAGSGDQGDDGELRRWEQEELKGALGDHLGLLASDLEVVLVSETTIDERWGG